MENSELQIFDNDNFGSLRVIMKDGQPWFIAQDVCSALDIVNTADALENLDSDEKSVLHSIFTSGENAGVRTSDNSYLPEIIETIGNTDCPNDFSYLRKDTRIVSESGLYALIFRSRKPEAKIFRKWVTSVVLPSIRKTGKFAMPHVNQDDRRGLSTKDKVEFLEKILTIAREHGCYRALAVNELILHDTGCDILEESGQNIISALGKPEYTPKQLAKILGHGLSDMAIDLALTEMGLQVYGFNEYHLTEKGAKYGAVFNVRSSRKFKHIANIKWHPVIIDKLRMHFHLDSTKALEQDGDSHFRMLLHMKTDAR